MQAIKLLFVVLLAVVYNAKDATPLKSIDKSEVATHNTESSAWLIIDGKVYDVTTFLDTHPGGRDVLLKHAGTDASEAFATKDGQAYGTHSGTAIALRTKYLIGRVA